MRLTTFSDYSMRLLIYVAAAPERKATIAEVAKAYGISAHHLVKVVHLLGRHGLLRNTRGRGGGIELARPASAINIADVVRLTEAGDMPAECFDRETDTCRLTRACRLKRALDEAVAGFYAALGRYTLEDVAIHRSKIIRLLR
mgnify:FL=1